MIGSLVAVVRAQVCTPFRSRRGQGRVAAIVGSDNGQKISSALQAPSDRLADAPVCGPSSMTPGRTSTEAPHAEDLMHYRIGDSGPWEHPPWQTRRQQRHPAHPRGETRKESGAQWYCGCSRIELHFNHQRHLNRRNIFKQHRAAAPDRVAPTGRLRVLDCKFLGLGPVTLTMPTSGLLHDRTETQDAFVRTSRWLARHAGKRCSLNQAMVSRITSLKAGSA